MTPPALSLVSVFVGPVATAQLVERLAGSHVWLEDVPGHEAVVAEARALRASRGLPGELTSCPRAAGTSLAVWMQGTLAAIDVHHGEGPCPTWTAITVEGLALTPEVEAVVSAFGRCQPLATREGLVVLPHDDAGGG